MPWANRIKVSSLYGLKLPGWIEDTHSPPTPPSLPIQSLRGFDLVSRASWLLLKALQEPLFSFPVKIWNESGRGLTEAGR